MSEPFGATHTKAGVAIADDENDTMKTMARNISDGGLILMTCGNAEYSAEQFEDVNAEDHPEGQMAEIAIVLHFFALPKIASYATVEHHQK